MIWTTLTFGKHKGKTLPQVLFTDPDWFFHSLEERIFVNKGTLAEEARELDHKARNIRIPCKYGEDVVVRYFIHPPTQKFAKMEVIPRNQPTHEGASSTFRRDVIDLSIPRRIKHYDKLGYRNMLSSVKYYLFGTKRARMTKARCEDFFTNDKNFVWKKGSACKNPRK